MMFRMSDKPRTITVYNLSAETGEFIGKGNAYIPPQTGLPAYCTDVLPPQTSAGKVAVFDAEIASWNVMDDHRGATVFDTVTGEQIHITAPGALPENVTLLSPDGNYQKWDGDKWVDDPDAARAARMAEITELKNMLMTQASEAIAPLQDAVELEIATGDEQAQLAAWKKYRVFLNRIDTEASEIIWPEKPA
ncbi:tail fiber assembly protein [Kosakonia cowanii]|uniref:tail fiber assembly protein n=1 Tax=Kosakonia cowanii TaxID=208223 RepID=UPI003B222FF9